MKRLYREDPLIFALIWIFLYCVLQSAADPLDRLIGTAYSARAVFCLLLAGALLRFIGKNRLRRQLGLCRSPVPARRFLYYVPLLILVSENLWGGAAVRLPAAETVCYMLCMLCVGFIEEILFRGFLFLALAKDHVRAGILISSLSFGLGHLLNLFNGGAGDPAGTLCQAAVATATGFLFVILFYRGRSLLPCILAHAGINMTAAFADEAGMAGEKLLIRSLIAFAVAAAYGLALTRTLPERPGGSEDRQLHI